MIDKKSILNKFNKFYDDESSHVVLVQGEWGVGKSFLVDDWLKAFDENKNVKVVRLSLYGIDSIYDLNSQLLENTFLSNQIDKKTRDLKTEIGFSNSTYSYNLSVSGLFSIFAKKEYKANSKKKYIILLDDIERKDNELKLNQVFGFIDSLKLENTKVILITNSNIFKEDDYDSFKLKEKIVDYDIIINEPTIEAINEILIPELCELLDISKINNLRVLKRFVKMYNEYGNGNKDRATLNIFLLLLMMENTNLYSRDEYIKSKINEEIHIQELVNHNQDKEINVDKISNDIRSKYSESKWPLPYILYEYIKDNSIYSKISEIDMKRGITSIFDFIKSEDYHSAFEYKFQYLDYDRKTLIIDSNAIFYKENPIDYITKQLNAILDIKNDYGFDYIDIYKSLKKILDYHNQPAYYSFNNQKIINEIMKFLPDRIANQIYESRIMYYEEFDTFMNHSNKYTIQIDNKIIHSIEKIYKNNVDVLLAEDDYIAKFGDEIRRINGIMRDTKCTFSLNAKKSIYKKLLRKAISLAGLDVSKTWHNIHTLFRDIKEDSELDNEEFSNYARKKISKKRKIQFYRVDGLIKQYLS